MPGFTAVVLNIMALGLIAMMSYQGLTRRVEFLSYRNIYLLGFIVFALVGGAAVITTGGYDYMPIQRPRQAINLYLAYVIVYLIVYLLSYHWNRLVAWIAGWFRPSRQTEASDWLLLLVALGFVGLAVFNKLIGWRIPGYSLLVQLTPASAAATALVGWVWGGRRFNLAVIVLGGFVFGSCLFMSVYGVPSRRPLIAVCAALAWGAWYRRGFHINPVKLVIWALPVVLVAMYLVGGWTEARRMVRVEGRSMDAIRRMLETPPSKAFASVLEGSHDSRLALWALDAYPERHKQRHLFSFRYMFYHPIPRRLWEDKPVPLSKDVARLANLKGVKIGVITLPPLVIGYGHAEGGLYALVLYALFFGQFTRFFDEILRQNPGAPFVLLAAGCVLGDLVGLARGDIAIMSNRIFLGFLITWFLLLIARGLIGRTAGVSSPPYISSR